MRERWFGLGRGSRGGSGRFISAKTASKSIIPASSNSTIPIQATTSLDMCHVPSAARNLLKVMLASAQVLVMYMSTVGIPVTIHTHHSPRVRQSHTVTPKSVSAASKLIARAEQIPKDSPHGDVGIAMSQQKKQRHARGENRANCAASRALPAGEFLQDVATEPRADIQRVVHKRGERHQREGNSDLRWQMDHFQKLADPLSEHLIRPAAEFLCSDGKHHHAAERNDRNHRFQQHRAVTHDHGIGFDAQVVWKWFPTQSTNETPSTHRKRS